MVAYYEPQKVIKIHLDPELILLRSDIAYTPAFLRLIIQPVIRWNEQHVFWLQYMVPFHGSLLSVIKPEYKGTLDCD